MLHGLPLFLMGPEIQESEIDAESAEKRGPKVQKSANKIQNGARNSV
jgi:hypothetical protein